jgi:hypothetical protein
MLILFVPQRTKSHKDQAVASWSMYEFRLTMWITLLLLLPHLA